MKGATEQALAVHLRRVSRLFVEHGTTTAEVKSGYGLDPAQELKMLRVIRTVGLRSNLDLIPTLLAHDTPSGLRRRRAWYIDMVVSQLIPQVVRQGLAEFFDVFCDRGYFSVSEAMAMMKAAARSGLKLKAHAEQLTGSGAAPWLRRSARYLLITWTG
jgi:imidazolonepropionase